MTNQLNDTIWQTETSDIFVYLHGKISKEPEKSIETMTVGRRISKTV